MWQQLVHRQHSVNTKGDFIIAEYIAFDPNVEIIGVDVMNIIMGKRALEHDPEPYLRKHGLYRSNEADYRNEWFNGQSFLDLLKDVSESSNNFFNLISIGSKVIEFGNWPPDVDSVEKAFAVMDTVYHMNHRNGEIGFYKCEEMAPRHIRVSAQNPTQATWTMGSVGG